MKTYLTLGAIGLLTAGLPGLAIGILTAIAMKTAWWVFLTVEGWQ